MKTDDDLERWLRHELAAHESRRPPVPELAAEVVADARKVRRRRSWLAGAAAVAASAVVVGGVAVLGGDGRPGRTEPPPSTQEPTQDVVDEPDVLLPGVWAGTLPLGEPPEVPYATKADLYLPNGKVVALEDDTVVMGETVAGTLLLVVRSGGGVRPGHWYALVAPDGDVTRLDPEVVSGNRVLEVAVSPDGRYLAGGNIVDVTTGEVVDALPDPAETVLGWTSWGIVYGAGRQVYLWSPGDAEPIELDGSPGGFVNGTDIGVAIVDSCPMVVRLQPDGSVERLSRHCGSSADSLVSPQGTWLLEPTLVAVDTATGDRTALAGRPVQRAFPQDVHWLSEDEILISVPGGGYNAEGESYPSDSALIVRCDLAAGTCERATDALSGPDVARMLSLP